MSTGIYGGSLSPADIGPNTPQTTFGFRQADEYDHDCDHGDDCGFDYGFDYDVTAGKSSFKLATRRIN